MADQVPVEDMEDTPPRKRKRRWAKRIGWVMAALIAPIVLGFVLINSPFGKRFIADQIADVAPASGLRFAVGRIEGDLYGKAVLHDVIVSDPQGEFLTIPVVELDWRPLAWLTSGIDVRNLTARRGNLIRLPELLPGDPDAPILPDFDIRVDNFLVENLTVAPGVFGEEAQRVDLTAQADVRSGRVFLDLDGKIGEDDQLALLVDAEPDGDRFDMALDYRAPRGGAIATMLGAQAGYRARIEGDGTWSNWLGHALVQREDTRFAGFRIRNNAGQYAIIGQVQPNEALEGVVERALGPRLSLIARGTLEESVFEGRLRFVSNALDGSGEGAIDLAGNAFDELGVDARLTDPALFGESLVLYETRIDATLDGPFRDLEIAHDVAIAELVSGETQVIGLTQSGTARFEDGQWTFPLDVTAARVISGNEWVDPRLVEGTLEGAVILAGPRLFSDRLRLAFPGLQANLALRGDTARGGYALAGPVNARGLVLDNIGTANANAKIVLRLGEGIPWTLRADLTAQVNEVSNATIANLAGPQLNLRGGIGIGGDEPLTFRDVELDAEKLSLALDGQVVDGATTLAGQGSHTQYGPFTVEAQLAENGPEAVLVFASPLPAAGLEDVRVALAPSENGFDIETEGGSLLGPFAGALELIAPEDGPTVLDIESMRVWKTDWRGNLAFADDGARGALALSGGGLDGTISLAPVGDAQGFDVDLTARDAVFGGDTRIALGRADIDLSGSFAEGQNRIRGRANGQGLSYANLFIGRFSAKVDVANGHGDITARIAGRRGSRFNLTLDSNVAPERMDLIAQGSFAGREINMPRRAVLTKLGDGGWRLSRTQIGYGDGRALAQGHFGGGTTAMEFDLASMPLSLVDVVVPDVGLGGTISGKVDFRAENGDPLTGSVRVKVDGLTRSGLILTSRPVDLALVADLEQSRMEARAVVDDDGERLGRVQARITNLPQAGSLVDRLQAGSLFAQLRYQGAADALWRLAAINTFDLTGPVAIAADATGTLANPRVRGSLSSDDLRIQSALSGTDLRHGSARGTFEGSRLRLSRFSGTAPGGGTVSGSGTVDLAGIDAGRGPQLDLRAAADNARLLNANGLSATVTGPLRIISNGVGGTIAGRLEVNRASWKLGTAADDMRLPDIATREVNMPADSAPVTARFVPWRYLIDARARNRIAVEGMGLNSEWSGDIILRGTTDDPRIGGEARVVRGGYSFAGTRFELTRGRIDFDENVPINPQIDIEAETRKGGLDVTVQVTGNALRPAIGFTSEPALPEEEILSRLLFGDSITTLSATDALQLGTALASLRGGSGLDPINQLRSAVGLDRLRIVGADPALGRGTGVALGKNVGRKFYIEIVTDGRGYSATELEFSITSWLALLGTVSTIGRNSVAAEISRDY